MKDDIESQNRVQEFSDKVQEYLKKLGIPKSEPTDHDLKVGTPAKNRYFHVVFNAKLRYPQNGYINGMMNFITRNGRYLNRTRTQEILQQASPEAQDFVIQNIIELSEEDYNNWTDQEKPNKE